MSVLIERAIETCSTCRHWERGAPEEGRPTWGSCRHLQGNQSSKFAAEGDHDERAFVSTREDFGCVEHQPR